MKWLAYDHPALVSRYESLYAHGPYAAQSYQRAFDAKVRPLLAKHGFDRRSPHRAEPIRGMHPSPPAQDPLF